MPERQGVDANHWQLHLNEFLTTVLGWQQLGVSNVDLRDPTRQKYRARGIDSVFAYRRNAHSYQQIVFVEAKTYQMRSLGQNTIQDWFKELIEKVEQLPHSQDFGDKFQPSPDAQFQLGLIGLWVSDIEHFNHDRIKEWLSHVKAPHRRTPIHIGLADNRTFCNWYAINQEVERIRSGEDCEQIDYWFPVYGEKPTPDGNCIPIESLFSKFAFCKATLQETAKNSSRSSYRAHLAFYLGEVRSYEDLHFIGLALKHFQLLDADEIILYTLTDFGEIRDYADTFRQRLEAPIRNIKFRQITPNQQLPTLHGAR